MKRQVFRIGFLAALIVTTSSAATFEWDAAWGWYPDSLNPGMVRFGVAPSTSPVLENGSLRITTLAPTENMGYICTGTNFVVPATLVLEARMRVLTNFSLQSYRVASVVGFTLASNIGNTLFIGKDEIFLGNGHASRGSPVAVDTDEAFHTYRVEVDGASATSAVRAYQDDILRLNGTLYQDGPDNGSDPRVYFGEASSLAHGSSLWARFSQNGAAQISTVRPTLSLTANAILGLHGLPGRTYRIDAAINLNGSPWMFHMNLPLPTNTAYASTVLLPPLLPADFFRAIESP